MLVSLEEDKMNNNHNLNVLSREKFLSRYSFTVAALVLPVINTFGSFLYSEDPSEQVFYDNFIIVAYLLVLIPLVLRLLAIFRYLFNEKITVKLLTKRQVSTYESYKIAITDRNVDNEKFEEARQTLYFTACNNIVWYYFLLLSVYVLSTFLLGAAFDIPNGFYNLGPSLALLVYKVIVIIKKQ